MLLSLMDDPNRLAVQRQVVWLTPERAGNRTQGIGVQFAGRHRRRSALPSRRSGRRSGRRGRIRCGVVVSWQVVEGKRAAAHGWFSDNCQLTTALCSSTPVTSIFPSSRRIFRTCSPRCATMRSHARASVSTCRRGRRCCCALRTFRDASACIPTTRTRQATVADLVAMAATPKVVAIETGLDYYRLEGDLEWRRERFRCHVRQPRDRQTARHSYAVGGRGHAAIMREERAGGGRRDVASPKPGT